MATLYEITGELLEFQEMMLDLNQDDDELYKNTLEGLEFELEQKAEGYAKVIKNIQAEQDTIQAQIDIFRAEEQRLRENKNVLINREKRMKEALLITMEAVGMPKIKGELFTLSIRNNAPQLPDDIENYDLPELYYKEPVLDRAYLLKAIKAGEVETIKSGDLKRSKTLNIR